MKLIIQIPCFNEETSLPITLADLPRQVPGFDMIEWLIVDDGSRDRTVEVAYELGVDHVVRLPRHQGLARTFMIGLEASITAGADVIVTTDADNQYRSADIPALVAPILDGSAQIVVGARRTDAIEHFSTAKKWMQRLGSWAVRIASGTDIPDAPSGFRAYHRNAAAQIYVYDTYTYTLDTIIQAGHKNIPISWAYVGVNPPLRPSRLMRSSLEYVVRSAFAVIRVFIIYKPLRFFTLIAALVALPGLIGLLRFLVFAALGDGGGHVQSLVISAALIVIAGIVQIGGLQADLTAANRRLLEDVRSRQILTRSNGELP